MHSLESNSMRRLCQIDAARIRWRPIRVAITFLLRFQKSIDARNGGLTTRGRSLSPPWSRSTNAKNMVGQGVTVGIINLIDIHASDTSQQRLPPYLRQLRAARCLCLWFPLYHGSLLRTLFFGHLIALLRLVRLLTKFRELLQDILKLLVGAR